MALLTDRDVVDVRDLLSYENDLLETADRERVELDTKIELAAAEIRTETEIEVDRILRVGLHGGSSNTRVESIVATPSLVRWIQQRCLALFFFECFGHQRNERFREKFEHYQKQAETAKLQFLQRGIGVVDLPLPRASAPSIESTGGALPAGNYYFAVTWTNTRGQESDLGTPGSTVAEGGTGIRVSHPAAPAAANGWNVYAGRTPDLLYRQNTTAMALEDSWLVAAPISESLPFTGSGQVPDRYLQPQQIFLRG